MVRLGLAVSVNHKLPNVEPSANYMDVWFQIKAWNECYDKDRRMKCAIGSLVAHNASNLQPRSTSKGYTLESKATHKRFRDAGECDKMLAHESNDDNEVEHNQNTEGSLGITNLTMWCDAELVTLNKEKGDNSYEERQDEHNRDMICIQETKMDRVEEELCKHLWGNKDCVWAASLVVNNDRGLLSFWDPNSYCRDRDRDRCRGGGAVRGLTRRVTRGGGGRWFGMQQGRSARSGSALVGSGVAVLDPSQPVAGRSVLSQSASGSGWQRRGQR
ncbi:hypothetical protein RJT34_19565 [Clitoria ternatea]|uniref:Uncharacterized protein n=1 Tax=Clitoria ternatea TaxID=43366 RepID=A0AAN9IRA8_CLITE